MNSLIVCVTPWTIENNHILILKFFPMMDLNSLLGKRGLKKQVTFSR